MAELLEFLARKLVDQPDEVRVERVEEVNRLLEGRKEMEKLMKGMGRGKLPQMPGAAAPPQPGQRKATKSNKRKKRSKTRR